MSEHLPEPVENPSADTTHLPTDRLTSSLRFSVAAEAQDLDLETLVQVLSLVSAKRRGASISLIINEAGASA